MENNREINEIKKGGLDKVSDKLLKCLGEYFLRDIYDRLYLLHFDYFKNDILVSFEKDIFSIKVLKKYDRVSNFMDKDYFYFIFSKDIYFNINWNIFINNLEKWIRLKEEYKNGKY